MGITSKEDGMSNKLLDNFIEARDALYAHCGFKEDWVTFPINPEPLGSVWRVDRETPTEANGSVHWANDEAKLNDEAEGDFYSAELLKHRFFDGKSVFRGADLTLVIGEPHVDGMRWLYVFDSHKEIKEKRRKS
jgi:hypothetical protein